MMGLLRFKTARFITVLFMIAGIGQAVGAELSTEIKQNNLNVRFTGIDYPAQFVDKELDSGLPNTITVYMTLMADDKLLHGLTINYQVVYDLWDEVYIVHKNVSDGGSNQQRFKTKAALLEFLSAIEQLGFYTKTGLAKSRLSNEQNTQLSAQVIVNPIKAERIKKIQAWIASSKGFEAKLSEDKSVQVVSTSPTGSVGAEGSTASGPRFQKLFDQILEQYMSGDDLPALWRSEKVTVTVNN